jgi:hypothetical protein
MFRSYGRHGTWRPGIWAGWPAAIRRRLRTSILVGEVRDPDYYRGFADDHQRLSKESVPIPAQ